MSIEIHIDGLDELRQAIAQAKVEVRQAAEREVAVATARVLGAAVKRIERGPASGKVYQSSVSERDSHQASAPGEAPMSDSGDLAGSIAASFDGLEGVVFTPLDYGRYLEFGTSDGKLKPRPWLLPSLEEDAPLFRRGLQRILR